MVELTKMNYEISSSLQTILSSKLAILVEGVSYSHRGRRNGGPSRCSGRRSRCQGSCPCPPSPSSCAPAGYHPCQRSLRDSVQVLG